MKLIKRYQKLGSENKMIFAVLAMKLLLFKVRTTSSYFRLENDNKLHKFRDTTKNCHSFHVSVTFCSSFTFKHSLFGISLVTNLFFIPAITFHKIYCYGILLAKGSKSSPRCWRNSWHKTIDNKWNRENNRFVLLWRVPSLTPRRSIL